MSDGWGIANRDKNNFYYALKYATYYYTEGPNEASNFRATAYYPDTLGTFAACGKDQDSTLVKTTFLDTNGTNVKLSVNEHLWNITLANYSWDGN